MDTEKRLFSHSMDLWNIIQSKRIILLVGSGGVGKTTVSAAIALQAALRGKKVLAVTVDPAKRLANSMGLEEVGNVETRINLEELGFPRREKGELWVMMLDVKHSLDELISKYAPNEEIANRILTNNVYRAVSDSLAGTEEFVALGKLYELQHTGIYDMIIVDTAPTRHAIDFFESPMRLVNLLDIRILQWFMKPLEFIHKIGFKTFRKGTSFLIERVERTIGLTFFTEIASFLQNFEGMFDILQDKARRINNVLKDPEKTALGVVSSAEIGSLNLAQFLIEKLLDLGMPISFSIINRIHPLYKISEKEKLQLEQIAADKNTSEAIKTILSSSSEDPSVNFYPFFREVTRLSVSAARTDMKNITSLKNFASNKLPLFPIPFFNKDVCDLQGLYTLGSILFKSGEVNDHQNNDQT